MSYACPPRLMGGAFIPSTVPRTLTPSRVLSSSFTQRTPIPKSLPYRRPRSFTMSTPAPPSFDDGMVLFAKAGPGGDVLGDCPFTWKANLGLRFKDTDFSTFYIDLANKPEWYLDLNEEGSTPTFVDGSHAVGDSDEIMEYADKIGRNQKLTLWREDDKNWDSAFDAVSPVFRAFVQLIKNKDQENEQTLTAGLTDALRGVDTFLRKVEGPYLLGDTICALDCNLAPKLQHVSVAGKHYKDYEIPAQFSDLAAYMERIHATEEWKASACTDDVIIWGWSKFF